MLSNNKSSQESSTWVNFFIPNQKKILYDSFISCSIAVKNGRKEIMEKITSGEHENSQATKGREISVLLFFFLFFFLHFRKRFGTPSLFYCRVICRAQVMQDEKDYSIFFSSVLSLDSNLYDFNFFFLHFQLVVETNLVSRFIFYSFYIGPVHTHTMYCTT